MVRVRFYTTLREAAGEKEAEISADNVKQLIDRLNKKYGDNFRRAQAACKIYRNGSNIVFAKGRKTKLKDGDELDFLPPTAGG
jgi:MoaD family protein